MENQIPEPLIEQAENQLIQLSDTIAQLKQAIIDLSAENNRLRIRNEELQALVMNTPTLETPPLVKTVAHQQAGKMRLKRFYDEGIHVCHAFFGMRRESGEECMFCQGVLDGAPSESK